MKKVISTIVALGFISSMAVSTAYAGDRYGHLEVLNPLWLPVAILSTVAATVATIAQPPVIFEQRIYSEPRQTVVYEEPRHYRQDRYYRQGPPRYNHYERERAYEAPRHRDYRDYREYR
ncbi:MAG: hypothetical protein IPQ16_14755 [Geobacteraceae bacterium]|nr:hypothetical protein [Geobacteraceae bacterium]